MRLKNVPGSREVIGESRFVIHEPELQKGKWKEVFGNENPIHIEIGMGKGRFIMGMAGQHPEVNFIGIEKYSSVLLRAIQKMEEEELPNVRFIRMDAEDICNVFDKGEVSRIYLNFSDPWPKDRHAKRRLPSRQFLARYDEILKRTEHWNSKQTTESCLILHWRSWSLRAGKLIQSPLIFMRMRLLSGEIS